MVLAQKQTHRSVEQNRAPRNKPSHIWSINLIDKETKIYNGEMTVSINGAGKTGELPVKE